MFFSKKGTALRGTKKKIIELTQLAAIWMDNEQINNKKLVDAPDPHWNRDEINGFYGQYVKPCKGISEDARRVISQILSILDEYGDVPSCGSDEEFFFAEITLLEHTLNVARISMDMIKSVHRDYEIITAKILIIALGHYIGLLFRDDSVIGGITAKSILMLSPMIADLPFAKAVKVAIGTYQDNRPKTEEAKILKAAISGARKSERARAKMLAETWGRPKLKIDKIKAIIKEE